MIGLSFAAAGANSTRFFDKPAARRDKMSRRGNSFFQRCGCAACQDVLESGNNTEREREHEADIYPRRPRGDRQLHPARDRRALRPDRLRHAARPVQHGSPVPAAQIEFVLVTHAHMDHTGHLPLLYKQGFRGTVYATEATCDLSASCRDSAHIQMSEAEWRGRKAARAGRAAPEPLYTLEDAEGVLTTAAPVQLRAARAGRENIIIRFTDVGHLLGSACIETWLTEGDVEKKIVFSGDIGNVDQLLRDPQTVSGADYVLIESTYGDRSHGERPDYLGALADCIQRTLDRGGNVVIPSFAVGRTQAAVFHPPDQGRRHGARASALSGLCRQPAPTRPRASFCRPTRAFSTTRRARSSAAA